MLSLTDRQEEHKPFSFFQDLPSDGARRVQSESENCKRLNFLSPKHLRGVKWLLLSCSAGYAELLPVSPYAKNLGESSCM